MFHIELAKNIGFCSGVRRAIDIVEGTLLKAKGRVYSLGPVIHNPAVIGQLEKRKLCVVKSPDAIEDSSTLILPSHGSPRKILDTAKRKKLTLIDVTCPYVSSVQRICKMLSEQKMLVVIVGDRQHPEIKALMDLAGDARIIDKLQDIKKDEFSHKKIGIISQTTQAQDVFFKIVSKILERNPNVKEVHIFNTICKDTIQRQEEVRRLAKAVDALLVIGSSSSANTKRLLCLGGKFNNKTYLVESEDMPLSVILDKAKKIGVISGASTPEWLVEKIVRKIRKSR